MFGLNFSLFYPYYLSLCETIMEDTRFYLDKYQMFGLILHNIIFYEMHL